MNYRAETRKQWNRTPCGTGNFLGHVEAESCAYFDRIRSHRHEVSDTWIPRLIPFAAAKGKRLLEIGHGIGSDLLTFAENGAEVHGIDITEEHHRLAKRNFEVHGIPVQLKLCDAADIQYPSGYFDIVYSHGVLHHTPDTARCLGEAYRVLKPGGLLILSVYRTYSGFHFFNKLFEQGLVRRDLFRLGYDGLMATIERGADGTTIKPLVKTYRASQLRHMLADYSRLSFRVGHFRVDHLSYLGLLLPRFLEPLLEPYLGWYLIAFAVK